MRLLKPGKGLIGVDITSATVKLVELKPTAGSYELVSLAVRPLGDGAVVERRIQNSEAVARTISQAVEHARPSIYKAAVAVPASAAITRTLSFPLEMSKEDIEECIFEDPERYVSLPFDELAIDFQPLGPSPLHDDDQQVLLVVCRQQDVRQLTETLDKAGLEPAAVDVETFAIERAFNSLRDRSAARVTARACVGLIDIGTHTNVFHVICAGHIVYSRDALFGGRQLVEAICERYGLSMEEAWIAKTNGGLPEDYPAKVLAPFLDTVAEQVGRSLQLYYAAGRHQKVEELVLTGVSSIIYGLAERVAADSGITVTIANPFQHLQINKRLRKDALVNDAPAMLVACGLAMRAGQ